MAEPPPLPDTEAPDEPPPLPPELAAEREIVGQEGVRTVDTLRRHACPNCGAKGEWNPRKKLLACPYCGFEFEALGPPGEAYGYEDEHTIIEHPLLETLQQLGQHAGDPGDRHRVVRCRHCEATMEKTGTQIQGACDFCGSPELVEYEDSGEWIKPESILPLQVPKEEAYAALRQWLGNRFWAPGSLKKRSLVDRLHGVYLPYWTFDAHSECPWSADSGTYYWDTESYRDADGRRRTRQVRKTRWRPASGHVTHFFDDVTIPAGGGVKKNLLREVEPFSTAELVPYATGYHSGWDVEAYQLGLAQGSEQAQALMIESLRTLCGREVPGDTYRNLRIHPSFSEQTWKHILVPVWIVAYQHSGRTYQCLVNGASGRIAGEHPISWAKVTLAVLIVVAVLVALWLAMAR